MNSETIYIAGPMRGRDGFNFPAFFAAEAWLKHQYPDAVICNPAREDIERRHLVGMTPLDAGRHLQADDNFTEADLRDALAVDMEFIAKWATLLVLLPGWEDSAGARAEKALADAIGIRVRPWGDTDLAIVNCRFPPDQPVIERRHPEEMVGVTAFLKDVAPDMLQRTMDRIDRAALGSASAGQILTGDEVRLTSETGGEKGTKLAAFDQISPEVLTLVAEHFGKGARKYAAHNFRRGYPWSLSYSALMRHLTAFWAGEEYDEETGSLHIVAVIWHAMALTEFFLHQKAYDDRFKWEEEPNDGDTT